MTFPDDVTSYLKEHHLSNGSLFYVVTTTDGLLEQLGNLEEILPFTVLAGEAIASFLPVFTGLFPVKEALYLPNIHLFNEQYFHIFLFPRKKETWIFLKDVSKQIQQMRTQIAQAGHGTANSFALLERLDYLVLKKVETFNYLALTFPQSWMNEFFGKLPVSINLEDEFPFLAFFAQQDGHAHYSGIWSQTGYNGQEFHLNAWAIDLNHQQFLLLQPVASEASNDQSIIQLARENRLAYEQLKKTKEQLQELVILKDQFVSIVSHDLRSPISTLTDGVSLLLDDLNAAKPFDESHREIIEQVRFELIRLLNYNNKLYNWVKLNMESIELNLTRVPLDLMLANLNGQFDSRLNEKKLRLKLLVNHHVELETDYVLLSQALANLLDNAIKFSYPGNEIIMELNEHSLRMTDRGTGMTKAKIEELLKGYSLKSTSGTSGETGTGLGLSIVVRIIKNLNLTLNIESETGGGTSFIISF
ncbi:MAG: HAMP domain-containing histidine kinase [Prolixibacteraceae bacterium]|nr:HAMP domain-containing histidine kinase [Prolixibacteraceae bacterium]